MRTIELPWKTSCVMIPTLREKALPSMLEHADALEQQLDQHAPEAMVSLSFTDDVFLRLYNWAHWQRDAQLPVEG